MCRCQHKYVPKFIKVPERLPQKTTRGDNRPAAITGRLPVLFLFWSANLRFSYD